jgi:cytidyltransferase-like protein
MTKSTVVPRKRVFVSGCFDLLHSGHVCFLQTAAKWGDLFVSLGADDTIRELKKRPPVCSEQERLYVVGSLKCVKDAAIARGTGVLDFVENLTRYRPDIFVVNEDGDMPEKRQLCAAHGIEYVVLPRTIPSGFAARSTSALREQCAIPYRIDLAGGWLDQPFVSEKHAGAVIVISVEPDHPFALRSGMATSTRECARALWRNRLPAGNYHDLAKMLFACENPPGTVEIAGSQDAIGIVFPGINRLDYEGRYWPTRIDSCRDEATLAWLESLLYLKPLAPRPRGFAVLHNCAVTQAKAQNLAAAADQCWQAILLKDAAAFGHAMHQSFLAQVAMFPAMIAGGVASEIDTLGTRVCGFKLAGAGGGGYLVLASESPISDCLRIRIVRP